MALQVDSARLLTYRAAWQYRPGPRQSEGVVDGKVFRHGGGDEVADLAIQVHGGWGFMNDCPVSRYYRDNRICTIGDGSSQIQKLLIARECGLDVSFS